MNIYILTIFPEMFPPFLNHGMMKRAVEKGKIVPGCINIRDYATGRHKVTDDRPYGGGSGMLMKPEPLAASIRAAKVLAPDARTILMSPQGEPFNQKKAAQLSREKSLIFICGRYEGVDERIRLNYVDEEISVGDYVLTGGELPAMVMIDAVVRLIPGVLGSKGSAQNDSFADGLLDCAHYTRPRVFEEETVPEILLQGNHKEIEKHRLESSLIRTLLKRKDLLEDRVLSDTEIELLKKWQLDIEKIVRNQTLHRFDSLSGNQ